MVGEFDAAAAADAEYDEAKRVYFREYRRKRREAGNPIKERSVSLSMDTSVCGFRSTEYNTDTSQADVHVCSRSPHVFEGVEEVDPLGLRGPVCLDEHRVRHVLPHCKRHMRDSVVQARIATVGVAECDTCKDMRASSVYGADMPAFGVEQAWMAPMFRVVFGPADADGKVWLECRWCQNDVERLHLSDRLGRQVPELRFVKRSGHRPLLDRVRVFMRYAHAFRRCGLRHSEELDSVFYFSEVALSPGGSRMYSRSAPNPGRNRRVRRYPDGYVAKRKLLARHFVISHLNGKCPACGAEETDSQRWRIDWWHDTATCRQCNSRGEIHPFLRRLLPWDVASLDEFGPRVEPYSAADQTDWEGIMAQRVARRAAKGSSPH